MKGRLSIRGLRLITYGPRGRGGGVKSPIHFYCILHGIRGEGVQIACILYNCVCTKWKARHGP